MLLFHETQAECPRVRLRVGRIATACVLVAAFVTASGMPAAPQPGSISLDPTHGPVRATVTIIGTGLSATSAVSFAGADAVFTVEDEEHVSATVPPGAATGPVQVDTTDGSVTSDPFVVQPNIVVILTDDHPGDQAAIDADRQDQLESLGAVDDLVGSTLQALDDTGRLNDTIVVFASDNGFELGEHRREGKIVPYGKACVSHW